MCKEAWREIKNFYFISGWHMITLSFRNWRFFNDCWIDNIVVYNWVVNCPNMPLHCGYRVELCQQLWLIHVSMQIELLQFAHWCIQWTSIPTTSIFPHVTNVRCCFLTEIIFCFPPPPTPTNTPGYIVMLTYIFTRTVLVHEWKWSRWLNKASSIYILWNEPKSKTL